MAVKRKAAAKRKAPAKPKAAAKPAAPKGAAKPPAASKQKTENPMRPFPVRCGKDDAILIITACSINGEIYKAHKRDDKSRKEFKVAAADCRRV